MAKDSVIKNIVRGVVKEVFAEELPPLEKRISKNIVGTVKEMLAEFRNDLTNMKDEIVGEIQDFREENTILELKGQHQRLLDVDNDVENLKRIHPKFTHAAI